MVRVWREVKHGFFCDVRFLKHISKKSNLKRDATILRYNGIIFENDKCGNFFGINVQNYGNNF